MIEEWETIQTVEQWECNTHPQLSFQVVASDVVVSQLQHYQVQGRSADDSHPMSAITGLVDLLADKAFRSELPNMPAYDQLILDLQSDKADRTELPDMTHVVFDSDSRLSDDRDPNPHTHDAGDIDSGIIDTARIGSGTPSSSTYLRGDQTWHQISFAYSDLTDVDTQDLAAGHVNVWDGSEWQPNVAEPPAVNTVSWSGNVGVPIADGSAVAAGTINRGRMELVASKLRGVTDVSAVLCDIQGIPLSSGEKLIAVCYEMLQNGLPGDLLWSVPIAGDAQQIVIQAASVSLPDFYCYIGMMNPSGNSRDITVARRAYNFKPLSQAGNSSNYGVIETTVSNTPPSSLSNISTVGLSVSGSQFGLKQSGPNILLRFT